MDLRDLAGERSISNEDGGSNGDGLWKTLVRASDLGGISLDGVVDDDLERLTCNDINRLVVPVEARSNLWTLGVQHHGAILIWSCLQSLLQVLQRLSMRLVVSVGEVKSSDVHASIEHLDQHVSVPAGWSIQKLEERQLTQGCK
jgi:hypothetical protein